VRGAGVGQALQEHAGRGKEHVGVATAVARGAEQLHHGRGGLDLQLPRGVAMHRQTAFHGGQLAARRQRVAPVPQEAPVHAVVVGHVGHHLLGSVG
jgi:hypothetical protein